jgi:hypothetical protein
MSNTRFASRRHRRLKARKKSDYEHIPAKRKRASCLNNL